MHLWLLCLHLLPHHSNKVRSERGRSDSLYCLTPNFDTHIHMHTLQLRAAEDVRVCHLWLLLHHLLGLHHPVHCWQLSGLHHRRDLP